jgi:hypothetical protein
VAPSTVERRSGHISHLLKKDLSMNRKLLTVIALAAATLGTSTSFAADNTGGLTREQVRAELAEAIRTGNMVANSESGQKFNELMPDLYRNKSTQAAQATAAKPASAPAAATTQGLSREQVRAELATAIRNGDMVANSESGQKFNELTPDLYPRHTVAQGKSREQVRAELAEAIRSGDMAANSESGQKLNELTPDLYPQRTTLQARSRAELQAEAAKVRSTGHAMVKPAAKN